MQDLTSKVESKAEYFRAWVNAKSPKPSVTYINAALSLFSNLEVIKNRNSMEAWLDHSPLLRPRARHALKLVLMWAASVNIPVDVMPSLKGRPLFSTSQLELLEKRSSRTINKRQHFVMALLYSCTEVPPGKVPKVFTSQLTLTPPCHLFLDGISYPITEKAIPPLKSWISLREKLARYDKERRFYGKSEAWAKSPYLFPNHRGLPADRSSIRKLLGSTAS